MFLNRQTQIDLERKGLMIEDAIVIAHCIGKNHRLTSLDLAHNFIAHSGQDEGIRALANAIESHDQLTALNVANNQIFKVNRHGIDTKINTKLMNVLVKSIANSKSLTDVNISTNIADSHKETDRTKFQIEPGDMEKLAAEFAKCQALKVLDVHGNFLGPRQSEILAKHMKTSASIETLKIWHCDLPIAKLKQGDSNINLSNCQCELEDGVVVAAFLKETTLWKPSIQSLDLSGNPVLLEDLADLANAARQNHAASPTSSLVDAICHCESLKDVTIYHHRPLPVHALKTESAPTLPPELSFGDDLIIAACIKGNRNLTDLHLLGKKCSDGTSERILTAIKDPKNRLQRTEHGVRLSLCGLSENQHEAVFSGRNIHGRNNALSFAKIVAWELEYSAFSAHLQSVDISSNDLEVQHIKKILEHQSGIVTSGHNTALKQIIITGNHINPKERKTLDDFMKSRTTTAGISLVFDEP